MRCSPDPPPDGAARADTDLPPAGAAPSPPETETAPSPMPAVTRLWLGRARRWGGILAAFSGAQLLIQAATLASGFILVNVLPVDQFAIYAFATSVLVALTFGSELGSSSALLYFFYRSRTEDLDFPAHAAAVASLRRLFFATGAPIASIVLALWGHSHSVKSSELLWLVVLVISTVAIQISSSIALVLLRLEGRYGLSYRAEAAGAVTRLIGVFVLVWAGWTRSAPALALAGVAAGSTLWWTRSGRTRVPTTRSSVSMARKSVLRYLGPTLPSAIYYALQGQFVIWLAAVAGGTTSIAQVGALGRLSVMMGVAGNLTTMVILPRLANETRPAVFRIRFFQFAALLAAIGLFFLGAASAFPRAFLFVLGPNYQGLNTELLLTVATAAVSLLGGFIVAINNSRSWTRWQPVALLILIVGQAALVTALPLGTTAGALWFGLGSATLGFVLQLAIGLAGFRSPDAVRW